MAATLLFSTWDHWAIKGILHILKITLGKGSSKYSKIKFFFFFFMFLSQCKCAPSPFFSLSLNLPHHPCSSSPFSPWAIFLSCSHQQTAQRCTLYQQPSAMWPILSPHLYQLTFEMFLSPYVFIMPCIYKTPGIGRLNIFLVLLLKGTSIGTGNFSEIRVLIT